ncbi:recombination regulator RecX [Kitasatospora sp. NPDC051170]|uniref:recombination regulator RecX n=1 Tax=Kitasatospora sp. NPDC051170 TaxID=3364056 RepID=UPI0037919AC9
MRKHDTAGAEDEYGPPDWFAAVAEEPGPAPGPGPAEVTVEELGLVTASELPTGRRRRRSALAAEQTDGAAGGTVGRAAGHGGAAAPGEGRRGRSRSGEERGEGRTARKRAEKPEEPEDPEDPESRARDICLRLLTGSAKSRKQLADALRKKEIPENVADGVLTRLEEVGLIDDAAFATAWVESRHAVRGLSRRALAQELRTKGVDAELVERAVAHLDYDDETEAARALVERRLRSTRGLETQVRMRRLVGVLARRGYSEGLAFRVVREALEDEGRE